MCKDSEVTLCKVCVCCGGDIEETDKQATCLVCGDVSYFSQSTGDADLTKITSQEQYLKYRTEATNLIALEPELDSPEGRRLYLLVLIIQDYEKSILAGWKK